VDPAACGAAVVALDNVVAQSDYATQDVHPAGAVVAAAVALDSDIAQRYRAASDFDAGATSRAKTGTAVGAVAEHFDVGHHDRAGGDIDPAAQAGPIEAGLYAPRAAQAAMGQIGAHAGVGESHGSSGHENSPAQTMTAVATAEITTTPVAAEGLVGQDLT